MNILLILSLIFLYLCFQAGQRKAEKERRRADLENLRFELEEIRRELRLVRGPLERSKLDLDEYLERNR